MASSSDWTVDTLKEYTDQLFETRKVYVDSRLVELEKTLDAKFEASAATFEAALKAANIAVNKSEESMNKRFEGVNEFRATLSDQQKEFMPRREVEVLTQAITARLDRLQGDLARVQDILSESAGRRGLNTQYVPYAIAIFSTLVAIAIAYFRK